MDHSVLSVAVISMRGETLISRTKFNIHDVFGIASDKTKTRRDRIIDGDAGVWTRAALEMTKQFDRVFGGSDALVTFYRDVKSCDPANRLYEYSCCHYMSALNKYRSNYF